MKREVLEALKLAEVLMPPFIRGLYQVLLVGIEAAWNEIDKPVEEDKPSGEKE